MYVLIYRLASTASVDDDVDRKTKPPNSITSLECRKEGDPYGGDGSIGVSSSPCSHMILNDRMLTDKSTATRSRSAMLQSQGRDPSHHRFGRRRCV